MGSTLFWLLLPHSIMDVWKGWFTFYFAGSNKNYQSMSIRSRNHTGFCPNKTYKMQLNHPWDEITKHMWQLFFGRYVYRIYRGDFTPFIAGSGAPPCNGTTACTAPGPLGPPEPGHAYRDAQHVFQAFRWAFRPFRRMVDVTAFWGLGWGGGWWSR